MYLLREISLKETHKRDLCAFLTGLKRVCWNENVASYFRSSITFKLILELKSVTDLDTKILDTAVSLTTPACTKLTEKVKKNI